MKENNRIATNNTSKAIRERESKGALARKTDSSEITEINTPALKLQIDRAKFEVKKMS